MNYKETKSIVNNINVRQKTISIIENFNNRLLISLYDKNNNKYYQNYITLSNGIIRDNKQDLLDKIAKIYNELGE
jgi:hypothetical protein